MKFLVSFGVGGRPVRSRVTRLMSDCLGASGAMLSCCFCAFCVMK